jgi:hypothetical protein
MATEQSTTDSAPSVESRIAALFDPEGQGEARVQQNNAEAKQEEQEDREDETADVEDGEEATDEEGEVSAKSEDYIDFEADDGSTIKLPAKAKDAVLRRQDYDKKNAQTSVRERLADDKIQYAEAREQLSAAVMDDIAAYKTLERDLAAFKGVDWSSLYESNPGQAMALQHRRGELQQQLSEAERTITGKAKALQDAKDRHTQTQWAEAEKGARLLIGTITQKENVAMAETVQALGISPKKFQEKYADPAIIAAVYKASKWDALQASKSVPKNQNAPPVVKAGAVSNMPAQVKQDLAFRKSMKSARDSNQRARLIERNLADRFK